MSEQPVGIYSHAAEESERMPDIRIINLPPVKMARSGHADLGSFNKWWSSVETPQNLLPRDFLWFNPHFDDFEWLFAIPEGLKDTSGYEVFDCPGGLYAVAVAFDDADVTRVGNLVRRWVNESKVYALSTSDNDKTERYEMGHIVGTMEFPDGTKRGQMHLFIPVVMQPKSESPGLPTERESHGDQMSVAGEAR